MLSSIFVHNAGATDFVALIDAEDFNRFGDIVGTYSGKQNRVADRIVRFKNTPEIVVTGPVQIHIINSEGGMRPSEKNLISDRDALDQLGNFAPWVR